MRTRKLLAFVLMLVFFTTSSVYADVLKQGKSGQEVKKVQTQLKKLGYFNDEITGYFGTVTENAVKKFQTKNGLKPDGIIGTATNNALFNVKKEETKTTAKPAAKAAAATTKAATTTVQKSGSDSTAKNAKVELLDWWTQASKVFSIGTTAKVIDVKTGKSFKIVRTYGGNHADCETATKADTETMKQIFGGSWSWERRPVILVVGDRKLAASMAGMPHAGVDSKSANTYVSSRSGGYGRGANLDKIKGNSMSGVFDVHFLNSRTHGTNKVDSQHQKAIKEAAKAKL